MNGTDNGGYINGSGDNRERVAILDAGAQYGKVRGCLLYVVAIYLSIMHNFLSSEKN